MEALVWQTAVELDDALSKLGLTQQELREVVETAGAAYNACTPNHPPSYAGLSAWAEGTCRLRELKATQGWQRKNARGFATVVNPAGWLAIGLTVGDDGTGDPSRTPRSKYDKGLAAEDYVGRNQYTFAFMADGAKSVALEDPCITWLLLTCRTETEIRYELSLPLEIGEDGHIDSWAGRIILPPVPIDASTIPLLEDKGEEIDVAVEKK